MAARGQRPNEDRRPAPPAPEPIPVEAQNDDRQTRAPEYKTQYGRVQAAVWSREIEGRRIYSVTLTRSYKDRYDRWQRTTSLDEEDLLPASKALDDAYTWIQRQRHQAREGGTLQEVQAPPRAANS